MATTNNPAGRLHALLSKYEAHRAEHGDQSIESVWSGALGLAGGDLFVALSKVSSLISETVNAASQYREETNDDSFFRQAIKYAPDWGLPLLLPTVQRGQAASSVHVTDDGMMALSAFSAMLSRYSSEGTELADDARTDLRASITDLMQEVRDDAELTDMRLKDLILARLHEVLQALDDYEFGGPGGVETACDRVAAAIGKAPVGVREHIWHGLRRVYIAIGFLNATAEGFDQIGTAASTAADAVRQIRGG